QNFNIHQRIFGGKDAQKGQFPYIVSMHIRRANQSYICGGSIIDHTWILTAAHCIHNADWVKIFYGSTTLWNSELSHVVYSDNIIEHEHYDNENDENDIALIRTPRVEYSELINKVSLPDRGNDYEGAWAVASGWGEIAHNSISKSLQFVGLQIDRKSSNTIIRSTTWDGTSCGRGDSGGPLVTQDDPKLIGVTSTGIGGYLTNFSRVSAYLDWIRSHTGLDEISHVVSSDNIIEHENYNNRNLAYDIALIRTPRVEYSELINKVSLADRDIDYEGAVAVASGWGQNEYGIEQENLQFIDLQIHSKKNCWNAVYEPSDTIICVGPFVGGGDSGGPLVTRDDPKLVGVTSFLDPGRLGGFSRVSSYLDWIRNHTGL
ncbi:hypothetical protein KR215_009502, partial [Drosophila sulfurigaster]